MMQGTPVFSYYRRRLLCLSLTTTNRGYTSIVTANLYKGSDVSRYEEKLEEAYQATTYAATHRAKSLAVCDYCDTVWTVGPQDILVAARYNPARTICATCGRPVRVFVRNRRNRFVAYFNTTDPIVACIAIIFAFLFYLGLLYTAYQ